MKDYRSATIKTLSAALKNKDTTSLELAQQAKQVIEEKDKDINAFVEVFSDIEEQAKYADSLIEKGEGSVLTGIPVAIKDNICIKNKMVTAGSKILEGFSSPYDATVIAKLKKEGAIFIGRVNCDEFAMGGSTETSYYGVTKNPYDTKRVSGGSSGGSAAAVAMGAVPYALASDTGGSIRQPASFCGCVGLKPTYGAVSRYGLIALASSLDCIGPITRNTEDAEIVFNALSEATDNYDSTFGLYEKKEYPKKMKIGVPRDLVKKAKPETVNLFEKEIAKLKEKGFEIMDISLDLADIAPAVYYIIQPAEASSNLARFDGVKYGFNKDRGNLWDSYIATRGEGFGDEVTRRIVVGNYVLSAGYIDEYYRHAISVRKAFTKKIREAMMNLDAIALPTTVGSAFKVGEHNDPVSMYAEDIFTVQANLAGMPAISIPMKTENLPQGIQFISNYYNEKILFEIGNIILSNQ